MALPKIKHPTFSIIVPSTGKEAVFRPFTVKEEKILLVAQSTGDMKEILRAILQVINNCAVKGFNIDEIASFDIDYIFIKLRSKSVNNIVKIEYKDPETNESVPVTINLDEVSMKYFEGHEELKNIKLEEDGSLGLIMRYPKPDIVNHVSDVSGEAAIFDIFKHCIDTVYDEDSVYSIHDGSYTDDDIMEFIESLSPTDIEKVEKFFSTMPRLHHVVKYSRRDGSTGELELQTLSDFFILG